MTDILSLDIEADGRDASRTLRQGADDIRKYQAEIDRLRVEAEKLTRTNEKLQRGTKKSGDTYRDSAGKLRGANGQFVAGAKASDSLAVGVFKAELAMKGIGFAADVVNGTLEITSKAFQQTVQDAASLEAEITRVSAVTQGGVKNFDLLKRAAVDAGSQSAFSAKQAGEGLRFLALAGFEANQQVVALPSVLQLATAGQLELARASDLSTNILSSYRFEVGELARVNDVLVKASTNANVTVDQIGKSFEFVGPIARAAGQDFNGLIASVAQLGNVGIQGDKAGTALRQALIRLQDPVPKAQRELDKLGIKVRDSSGEMREFVDILADLERAGATSKSVSRIFGTIASSGVNALLGTSDQIRAFQADLDASAGEAARIEAEILNTFSGQLQIFQGQLSTLSATIGDEFLPVGTELLKLLIEITNGVIQDSAAIRDLDVVARDLVLIFEAGTRSAATLAPAIFLVVGVTLELAKGSDIATLALIELFDITTNFIPVLGQLYDLYQLFEQGESSGAFGALAEGEIGRAVELFREVEDAATSDRILEFIGEAGNSLKATEALGVEAQAALLSAADGAGEFAATLAVIGDSPSLDDALQFFEKLTDQIGDYTDDLKTALDLSEFTVVSFDENEIRALNREEDKAAQRARARREAEAERLAKVGKRNALARAELKVAKELDDLARIQAQLELEQLKIKQQDLTALERELALFQAREKANADVAKVIEQQQAREQRAELDLLDAKREKLALTDQLGALELSQKRALLELQNTELDQGTKDIRQQAILLDFAQERARIEQERQKAEADRELDLAELRRKGLSATATVEQQISAIREEQAAKIAKIQVTEQDAAKRTLQIREATRAAEAEILAVRVDQVQRFTGALRDGLAAETGLLDASFDQQSRRIDAQIERLDQSRQQIEASGGDTAFVDRRIAQLEAEADGERRVQELLAKRLGLLESLGGATLDLVDSVKTLEFAQQGSADAQTAQLAAISAAASLGAGIAAAAIKDTRRLAVVQALFEGAAAVAAFASYAKSGFLAQNFLVASLNHAAAATKFGIVAGTAGAGGGTVGGGGGASSVTASAGNSGGAQDQQSLVDAFTRALRDVLDKPVSLVVPVNFEGATLLESAPRIDRRIQDSVDRARSQTFRSLVG